VVAACGGVDLDLRGANLDPTGATLLVQTYCGGVQVQIPEDWRIQLEVDSKMGGVEATVTPPDDLPENAPTLRVEAIARLGGVLVTAESNA
jgi:predicted membrane protein